MPHPVLLLLDAGAWLFAAASLPASTGDVPIFERAALGDDLAVTAFGIIEDSRCVSREFCFEDDRLIVAAVVHYRGKDREVALEMGEQLPLESGTLTLTGTSTPPVRHGAIALKEYRLELEFQPKS